MLWVKHSQALGPDVTGSVAYAKAAGQRRTEAIREAMLALLPALDRHAKLSRRLRHASDALALWYLRSELMEVLAVLHGEVAAASSLSRITREFKEVLPEGLASRLAGPAQPDADPRVALHPSTPGAPRPR